MRLIFLSLNFLEYFDLVKENFYFCYCLTYHLYFPYFSIFLLLLYF